MIELVFLQAGEEPPRHGEPGMLVEAAEDGKFYATGWGKKVGGDDALYISLPEDDVSLERAVAAAAEWAEKHGIRKVWVQTDPWIDTDE